MDVKDTAPAQVAPSGGAIIIADHTNESKAGEGSQFFEMIPSPVMEAGNVISRVDDQIWPIV